MRKKKTTSEQYVRERKSNATKQFAYNKLKTERHQEIKLKPSRPPQPKLANAEKDKEGMLIDLSPNENPVSSSGQLAMSQTPTSVCLLDAPIEVPTENSEFSVADVRVESKLEPPPYQYPPTYMNTLGLSQGDSNVNKSFSTFQQINQSDPFDTSYINEDPNLTTKSNTSLNAVYNNIQTSNSSSSYRYNSNVEKNFHRNATDSKQNNSNGTIAKQKPVTLSTELDTLVMNTMASLSPRNSVKNLSITRTDNKYSNNLSSQWNSPTQNADLSNNESLSDSLRVNLSSLSLDDSINNSATTPKKLEKSLYSDLEKEMYKSESCSVNVNTSQNYDRISLCKENSVSAIPSEIYERRSDVSSSAFSLNKVQNSTPKTVKQTNTLTKSTNQEIAQIHRHPYETPMNFTQNSIISSKNYTSSSMHPYAKQNNTEITGSNPTANDTNSVINQIWFEQTSKDVNVHSPRKSFYSNVATSLGPEKNHNFVAISNRPSSMIQNDTKPLNTNIYSSVAGDFYSSVAGDFYETIPPNNAAAALYASMPRNNSNSIYGNESQTVPVIYDEVSNDEILRPHRPAPLAPPPLSSQQIQRRMEKERQLQQQIYGNLAAGTASGTIESQKVLELMQEIGGDATHIEATQALQAVGWDHALAVRHFKVERLMR